MEPNLPENPFNCMKKMILDDIDSPAIKLREKYSLSNLGAKSVWLSCPEFQERFCRKRIHGSKARGGSEYGNKHFLKRRYKLTEHELDLIFRDIWNSPSNQISSVFMSIMTVDKIAEVHLTKRAQSELSDIKEKYTA